jgi:hypothetical protein
VSNVFVHRVNRFSSKAVISPSSVLPPAMQKEVNGEPKVVTLARKAPAAIAGHSLFPHSRRLANASPLGGQTGLAFGCSDANVSAAFASAK